VFLDANIYKFLAPVATKSLESVASLSSNHFPNPDLLCSNHLWVATSTSRLKPKASGGH